MRDNAPSIFTVRGIEKQEERAQRKYSDNGFDIKDILKACLSALAIIVFCILFAIPWTTIPRTNSIIHQSHWWEVFLAVSTSFILSAGSILLDLISWTQERSLISLCVYLKMYFMIVIPCILLYIACYMVWSKLLLFNHPLPNLALICLLPTWIILPLGLWLILPSHLLKKQDFRRKLKMYMRYFLWFLLMVVQNEVLSLLFANAPSGFQFLVIILVIGCHKFDWKVRSRLITKMMGKLDETAMVLLSVNVDVLYSIFIAVRLVGAELATVCCSVVLGFIFHFLLTCRIIQEFRKLNIDLLENENSARNMRIKKLVITELIEGLTPIIYGICIAMAYYGPNAHLLSNIGNTYWSEKMDDIGPLLQTMSILFVVDTLSAIITSIIFWKVLKVNMAQEYCRVLTKYWFLIAIPLDQAMSLYFATDDVNLGLDDSHTYSWISNEGRQQVINTSNVFGYEDKAMIPNNTILN